MYAREGESMARRKRMSTAKTWGWHAAAARLGMPYPEYAARRLAGLRVCSACHEWKPLDAFYVSKATGEPSTRECRECSRARCESFKAAYLAEHGTPYVPKSRQKSTA
jgi:hypothetical protein